MDYTFTEEEINYVLELLGNEPAKKSIGLINNIHAQYHNNKQELQQKQMSEQEEQSNMKEINESLTRKVEELEKQLSD